MTEREGASKTSEAVVVSMYPDVCLKDGKPVPYDLFALASDDVRHSPNVRYTGYWTLNKGSRLSTCYGDDPATAGVTSGVVQGICRPVGDFATKVNVNGLLAVRHDTIFDMNCAGFDGASNTQGKLVYMLDTSEVAPDEEFERRRLETLERLKEHYGQSDFYDQLALFDPQNAEAWNVMAEIQAKFHDAEAGYDPATKAYSESMRETLHQSVINLFEDSDGLRSKTESGSTGLYDWYIYMHGTAFNANGAWNIDFIHRSKVVFGKTDERMYQHWARLGLAMALEMIPFGPKDQYALAAAEQVRERRAKEGLRVSKRPGETIPETEGNRQEWQNMWGDLLGLADFSTWFPPP